MTQTLILEQESEVYLRITGEPGVLMELNQYFRFRPNNYQFMPMYRARKWDGYVYLYNMNNNKMLGGLKREVLKFAKDRNYTVVDVDDISNQKISLEEFTEFIQSIPNHIKPRDYQLLAIKKALDNRRTLLLSPTASGKSLIIYYLMRYLLPKKILLIVPTISLVSQMKSDFEDYAKTDKSFDVDHVVHQVFAGQDKSSDKPVVISTWQSLYEQKKSFFASYDAVIGDEAHLYKSKSLSKIMTSLTNASYRIGTTGTLDDTEVHKLILQGHFGPVFRVTHTKDLIRSKTLSNFDIRCLVLKYSKETSKRVSEMDYQQEMDFLVTNETRNKYICNLVEGLRGNTLILFQYVDKHGKPLYNMLKDQLKGTNRNIYFVYGGTDGTEREEIRALVESETNAIICASYGVYSTGVNIRNLHSIIFSSPSKSKIRTLQSIGRGLRKSETKESAVLYDIADDLSYRDRKNYTLNHFMERVRIYSEERFPYHLYTIQMRE